MYACNGFHHFFPKAAKKDHTLLRVNEEKKAKWRAEAEKDQEAAAVKAQ